MYCYEKRTAEKSFLNAEITKQSKNNRVYLKRWGQIKPSPHSLVYIYISTHIHTQWRTFIKPCRNCKWLEGKEADCSSQNIHSHAITYTMTLPFIHVTQKSPVLHVYNLRICMQTHSNDLKTDAVNGQMDHAVCLSPFVNTRFRTSSPSPNPLFLLARLFPLFTSEHVCYC